MAKLLPQPPHIHLRIFIGICFLISFLRSRKNMFNFLLSIWIWGHYINVQCLRRAGEIFLSRALSWGVIKKRWREKREMLNSGNNQSKSAIERKREKLNSGNNQDILLTNMIFAGKVNFRICLPKSSEKRQYLAFQIQLRGKIT